MRRKRRRCERLGKKTLGRSTSATAERGWMRSGRERGRREGTGEAGVEEEEGEDWDELERKAKKRDRESGFDDEEERAAPKKRRK